MAPSILNLAIALIVATCILVCSSAFVCANHLRFVAFYRVTGENAPHDLGPIDEVCYTWAIFMRGLLGRFLHDLPPLHYTVETTDGLLTLGVAFPFFLACTTVYFLSLLQKKKKKMPSEPSTSPNTQKKQEKLGDPAIHWWSFLVLFLPTALICVDVLRSPMESESTRLKNMSVLARSLLRLANPFGVGACISLSFFLVPVARGSYTIEWESNHNGLGWSWSPMHALVFHRWAGWFGGFFTALHGIIFCVVFVLNGVQYGHQSPLQALWEALIPSKECWPSWLPWSPSHHSVFVVLGGFRYNLAMDAWAMLENYSEANTDDTFPNPPPRAEDANECYGHWRNFTGLISALSFLVLCLTSFSWVRRRFYSLFWKTHVIAGSMMLVFAILHFETILMYLFPSMAYYLATTIPTLIHQFRSYANDGVQITHIRSVEDSGGCVEVTMSMSSVQHHSFPENDTNDTDTMNFSSLSTPVYARICVPSISTIWHPFSVMINPKHAKDKERTREHRNSLSIDTEGSDFLDPLLGSADSAEPSRSSEDMEIDDYEVVVFFRSIGPFTKAWAKHLISTTAQPAEETEDEGVASSPTALLVDGFYPGAFPIPKIMQRHDAIFMMAGGVGIVPFVSVLQAWYHYRRQEYKHRHRLERHGDATSIESHPLCRLPRKIVLYWSCREPGLVNHFLDHHLNFLWNDDGSDINVDPDNSNDSVLPSIEIFCHLTRGGLARPSTFPLVSPEQSTLEDGLSSSLPSNRNGKDEEEGTVPTSSSLSRRSSSLSFSSGSEITSLCQREQSSTDPPPKGRSIEASRFDWISFLVFSVILWFSFLVQSWQYCRRLIVNELSTSVRGHSIYLTVVWSILVALAGECFRAWYFQKNASQLSVESDNHVHNTTDSPRGQVDEDERIGSSSLKRQSNSLSSRQTSYSELDGCVGNTTEISDDGDGDDTEFMGSTFVHRSSLSGVVSVRIVSGRPDYQDIFDPVSNSDSPAVLLCGPEKLRESVRQTVQVDKGCAKKCSVYEEVSEM